MDWWPLVGAVTVVVLAVALDGELDEPDWMEEAPYFVRVALRTALWPLGVVAAMLALSLAVLFWQVVGAVLFVVAVAWMLALAPSNLLGPVGQESPGGGSTRPESHRPSLR